MELDKRDLVELSMFAKIIHLEADLDENVLDEGSGDVGENVSQSFSREHSGSP